MAFCGVNRVLSSASKKYYNYFRPPSSTKVIVSDPLEHATGIAKRELLAKLAGNDDPFDMKVFKRGPGTRHEPTEIPSAFDSRIVGCVCEEEATSIRWMWLHKDEPRRCECGYWFQLVHKAPV